MYPDWEQDYRFVKRRVDGIAARVAVAGLVEDSAALHELAVLLDRLLEQILDEGALG